MNFRKFISANSYIIGTAIIALGFALMIINAITAGSFDATMVYFFITLSGIIFWGIGYKLNPNRGFTIAPIETDEQDEEAKKEEKDGEEEEEEEESSRNTEDEKIEENPADDSKSETTADINSN